MPRPHYRVLLLLAWLSWPGLEQAIAAEEPAKQAKQAAATRWSADVAIGVEYDSNISVEEVDSSINQGDYALTLDAGVGMRRHLSQAVDLGLSYDFSQSQYAEFSKVDRQTHILGADLAVDLGGINPGISVYYINSNLDGRKFLELYRVSPSISGFLSKRWFARGAYAYADKTIDSLEGRDARTNSIEADLYYFQRGLRSYFNLGYRLRDENAEVNLYDYVSHSLKLRFIRRIELFSKLTKLELAWRYEHRDYNAGNSNPADISGGNRQDRRNRWRVDYEIPVTTSTALQFFYGYADYESNYPAAAYDQTQLGARLNYAW